MSKNKRNINVTGTYIEGDVHIQQGDFVGGNQNKTEFKVEKWFLPIYQAISKLPKTTKQKRTAIQNQVKEIETEVQKGEKADQSFLVERLKNLKMMAPDIWEVVLSTISNPLGGLSLAITKVAKKAAEEASQRK